MIRSEIKERPILFSAPMVRAILAGRKTQTRRMVKGRHIDAAPPACFFQWLREYCPYGKPGDRLWVREAWCPIYPQDHHYNGGRPIEIDYAASHSRESYQWRVMDDSGSRRWKPSIHMPRWASRILLEITGVRVERLQDVSDADALAEGVAQIVRDSLPTAQQCGEYDVIEADAVDLYRDLWEQINGPGAWDANPWVWVVEFRRIEQ